MEMAFPPGLHHFDRFMHDNLADSSLKIRDVCIYVLMKRTTIITVPDSHGAKIDKDEKFNLKRIACLGRHENHYLILQYSDKYPLNHLYTPEIRAQIGDKWVITQKVEDHPAICTNKSYEE